MSKIKAFKESDLISIEALEFRTFGKHGESLVLSVFLKSEVEGKGREAFIVCPALQWFEYETGLYVTRSKFDDYLEEHNVVDIGVQCVTKSSVSNLRPQRAIYGTNVFRTGEFLYQIIANSGAFVCVVSDVDPILYERRS